MKLEWLEDLLAVMDTGSLTRASRKRFLSQPAFTRRIQSIENHIGAELFDRNSKPLQLKSYVIDNEPKIRQVALALRELTRDLKQGNQLNPTLVLGCQHSISTAVAPKLVKALSVKTDASIRIRSANRDECYAYLLTGEVDIVLMYRTAVESDDIEGSFVKILVIENDALIPIMAFDPGKNAGVIAKRKNLSLVRYPDDVFFGKIFNNDILPQINDRYSIRWIAETALTPAALQFALSGVGIAWVPRSLAQDMLDSQLLIDLSGSMPTIDLEICGLKLKKESESLTTTVWDWLVSGQLPVT